MKKILILFFVFSGLVFGEWTHKSYYIRLFSPGSSFYNDYLTEEGRGEYTNYRMDASDKNNIRLERVENGKVRKHNIKFRGSKIETLMWRGMVYNYSIDGIPSKLIFKDNGYCQLWMFNYDYTYVLEFYDMEKVKQAKVDIYENFSRMIEGIINGKYNLSILEDYRKYYISKNENVNILQRNRDFWTKRGINPYEEAVPDYIMTLKNGASLKGVYPYSSMMRYITDIYDSITELIITSRRDIFDALLKKGIVKYEDLRLYPLLNYEFADNTFYRKFFYFFTTDELCSILEKGGFSLNEVIPNDFSNLGKDFVSDLSKFFGVMSYSYEQNADKFVDTLINKYGRLGKKVYISEDKIERVNMFHFLYETKKYDLEYLSEYINLYNYGDATHWLNYLNEYRKLEKQMQNEAKIKEVQDFFKDEKNIFKKFIY